MAFGRNQIPMKLCPMPSRDTDAETTGIRCLLPPVIFQSKHSASCIINSLSHHKTFKHFPNFCSTPTALKHCRPMAAFDHGYFQSCFKDWIAQQHQDLEELLSELSTDSVSDNEKLKLLTENSIKHFEEYSDRRALMVQHDAPSFLSPSWCSSFENAFLWMGGCRSSLSVRLVYSVCGSELNSQLTEFLLTETKGNLYQQRAAPYDQHFALQDYQRGRDNVHQDGNFTGGNSRSANEQRTSNGRVEPGDGACHG